MLYKKVFLFELDPHFSVSLLLMFKLLAGVNVSSVCNFKHTVHVFRCLSNC